MTINDKDLYKKFIQGDINAFESLVLFYKDNLIYFIFRYTKDFYIAEDIAQDIFAYIYVYPEKYNIKYSFKTFIFTIGKNKAIDYIRKQSKVVPAPFHKDYEPFRDIESLEDKIIKDEEQKLLFKAIRELNPDYSRAIYLADIEELSYKEIGKILGKTLGQTKVLIYRARKSLKLKIEKGAEFDEK